MNNIDVLNIEDLDDSFSSIRGGGRGGMGGGMMGGGVPRVSPAPISPALTSPRVAPVVSPSAARVAPALTPAVSPARIGLNPQQRHNRMVARYYRHNPYGGGRHRRWGISPYGWRWFNAGSGYLYGYPYEYLYPLFYYINLGYDEEQLRLLYNIPDEDWNTLMMKLRTSGYIYNY